MHKFNTIILVLFLTLFAHQSKAQYVTIPDPNFILYLQSYYPASMTGNQLDTTNTGVINDTLIYLPSNISNLDGIQYFDNLKQLFCSNGQLSNIPALPNKLEILLCYQNQLTSLPTLPDSLKYFACEDNQLTSLPALPNGLLTMTCGMNQLTSLPVLPSSLNKLYCNGNLLTNLPMLPNSLTWLECNHNQFTALPTLPANILHLVCHSNQLASLPNLPNSLQILDCSYNPFTNFPTVLPTGLQGLNCSYNGLSNLPPMPSGLTGLHCQGNQLTSLPALPNIVQYLGCSNNQISSLDKLPDSLVYFDCTYNNLTCLPYFVQDTFSNMFFAKDGNNITCIPKNYYTPGFDSTMYLPICSIASGCPVTRQILGNIHQDTSANCISDSLHNGIMLKNIKVQSWKNGVLDAQKYSDASGIYSFGGIIGDQIDVRVDTTNLPFYIDCPISNLRSATLSLADSVFMNQDFGVRCKTGIDLGVQAITGTYRNAIPRQTTILAGDISQIYNLSCVGTVGGTVTTTITGLATYYGPAFGALTPNTVIGNTLTYSISDFSAIDLYQAFNIEIKADTNAPIGSPICIKTIINTLNDVNSINDTLEYCGEVNNSFDPNLKSCFPTGIATPDSWLTYTIQFQNTGSDTAYHIYITDTLDTHLNLQSFTFLASSHPAQVSLEGRNTIFNFPNINLVDSMHNEPLSHGWVQYKIKSNSNLQLNSVIDNTAFIYFDLNAPVVTNTTHNTYGPSGLTMNNENANLVHIFPNPSKGDFYVQASIDGVLKIYDLTGAFQREIKIKETSKENLIDVHTISRGTYLLIYVAKDGSMQRSKITIE